MGGAEVRLKEADNIVITLWGGTDILLPTLAEKIKRLHRVKSEGRTTDAVTRRTNVITFQGATIFKLPTLGKEVEELMQLRDASNLSQAELMRLWEEVIRIDDFDVLETFTVMGGAGEEKPSKKEELNDLERLTLKGLLSVDDYQDLKKSIQGQDIGPMRNEFIQEKLRSLLLPPHQPPPIEGSFLPPSHTIVKDKA